LQPRLAVWEAFHDPKDGKVKVDGETVTAFPKLPDFQQSDAESDVSDTNGSHQSVAPFTKVGQDNRYVRMWRQSFNQGSQPFQRR
jgi:hypothetical protein